MASPDFQKLQKALSLFGTKVKAVFTNNLEPIDVAVKELRKMHPSPDPDSSFQDDLGQLSHDYGIDVDELSRRYFEISSLENQNGERPDRIRR